MGWDVFAATFIGGVLIGVPVALLSFFIVWQLARKWRRRHRLSA
jgi:peptidoglycan/LPS O-acetylase OafA/YrhL